MPGSGGQPEPGTRLPGASAAEVVSNQERADGTDLDGARRDLLQQVEAIADPLMVWLGLAFLVLLLLQIGNVPMTPAEQAFLDRADDVIYGAFVVDFLLRLLIVPDRWAWVRRNWLLALSLLLPALRPLRVLRLAPSLASLHAAALVGGANRGLLALRRMLRGKAFLYLVVVTTVVVVVGAGVVWRLEQGHPETPFVSFGEALWWAATLVTTVNSSDDPVSGWGRVVAVLMRIYAVGVFGYLTASIASYFVAQVGPAPVANDAAARKPPPAPESAPEAR